MSKHLYESVCEFHRICVSSLYLKSTSIFTVAICDVVNIKNVDSMKLVCLKWKETY